VLPASSVFDAAEGTFNIFESEKWMLVGGASSVTMPRDYRDGVICIRDKSDAYTHYRSGPDLQPNIVELPQSVAITVDSFVSEPGFIANGIPLAKLLNCRGIGTVQGFLYT
jgi:hypothetical protein